MALKQTIMMSAIACLLSTGAAFAIDNPTMKSPTAVKAALGTLNRVVDHTRRLVTAKNYAQVPHESQELKEGTAALEKAISSEPDSFKDKVASLVKTANSESDDIVMAANAHDDGKLAKAHAELAKSVETILTAFPSDVQPSPPSVAKEKTEEKARD